MILPRKQPFEIVDDKVIKEGYLMKEGNNIRKDWRKRWCVLKATYLYYYKDQNVSITLRVMDTELYCNEYVANYFLSCLHVVKIKQLKVALGRIDLLASSVKGTANAKHIFEIALGARTYKFQAKSGEYMLYICVFHAKFTFFILYSPTKPPFLTNIQQMTR